MDEIRTVTSVDLVLRNDNLATVSVLCTRNGGFKETDRSDDFAFLDYPNFPTVYWLSGAEITWIPDDLLGLDSFVTTSDPDEFPIRVRHNFVDGFVEHICTSIDGTQTSERLGKFTQPVQRINIR